MTATDLDYLMQRHATEQARLNLQQDIFEDVLDGECVHVDGADVSKLDAVLDVATGTGIWLQRLAEREHRGKRLPSDATLVGCDIDSSQVNPSLQPPRYSFFQHDVLQPLPEEHHGKYDFVQMRLVLMAMNVDSYRRALVHLRQALKPGGYLQVLEFNPRPADSTNHPVEVLLRDMFDKLWARTQKDPPAICRDMQQHLEASGFHAVQVRRKPWPWGHRAALSLGMSAQTANLSAANSCNSWAALKKPILLFKDIGGIDTEEKYREETVHVEQYFKTQGYINELVVATARRPSE